MNNMASRYGPHLLAFVAALLVALAFLFFICYLLERWMNHLAIRFSPRIGISVPKIHINLLHFSIFVENLNIESDTLLEKINTAMHDNCQFMGLGVSSVVVTLFPRIHVTIDGVVFLGYAKHPNNWSVENVMASLRDSRLHVVDALTATIARRLRDYNRGAFLQYLGVLPLHVVDILIGTASLDIFNARAGFCSRRMFQPDDVQMEVTIEHLQVRPLSTYNELFFSPMIKMGVIVNNIKVTAKMLDAKDESSPRQQSPRSTIIDSYPPLLYPVTVTGEVTLPKILSQMLRQDPLQTKYCHLDLKAPHMVVDFGAVNALGVINFSLAVIMYRLWYTHVMSFFEKSLEASSDVKDKDTLASYIALHSSYRNSKNPIRRRELRASCRQLEASMSTATIQFARSLSLGWRENEDFYKCFNIDRDKQSGVTDIVDFDEIINAVYAQELLNTKEMRYIKVDITADQVDFRLSTPRTSWNAGNGLGACPADSAPPATMSLMGITLRVVDPLVPASYDFDRVRDIDITLERLRFAAGETSTPSTADICLQRTLLDRCWMVPAVELSLNDEEAAVEDTVPMVDLHIHEDVENEILTVDATLSHAAIVIDVLNMVEMVEFGLTLVEELAAAISFWTSCVDLPADEILADIFPSSILAGKKMRVSAGMVGMSLCIREYMWGSSRESARLQLPAQSTRSLGRISFDAKVIMVSNKDNETICCSVTNFSFAPFTQNLSSKSKDERYTGVRACRLLLSPFLQRICESDTSDFRADVMYNLQIAVQPPPVIFGCDGFMNDDDVCDLADEEERISKYDAKHEKRFHRKRDTIILMDHSGSSGVGSPRYNKEFFSSLEQQQQTSAEQTMLLRYISCQSEPFVQSVSEQEIKIMVSWCQYMVNTVPSALSSLDLNVTRIQTTAEEVRNRLERREFMTFLEKLFRTYGIRSEEHIPDDKLRAIFEMFLEPMHLLASEKREQIRDFMFIFDRNLDGLITPEEFVDVSLDLFMKSGWGDSGEVSLKLSDYEGVSVPRYFALAFKDGHALNELWRELEAETPLRRGSGNLAGLSPQTVQMMLVRLVADAALAKDIWENIIRLNLTDNLMHLYPWVIADDHIIEGRQPTGTITRNRIRGKQIQMAAIKDHAYQAAHPDHNGQTHMSPARRLTPKLQLPKHKGPSIDMTHTRFNVNVGHIQINVMDSLLGPRMPRFQHNLSDTFLNGSVLHRGIVPNLSFTSTYGLQSDLLGGLSIDSTFFNSKVGAHEPFIEPYAVQFAAIKHPEGHTVSFDITDRGSLFINVSAAWLHTCATFVLTLDPSESKAGKDVDDNISLVSSAPGELNQDLSQNALNHLSGEYDVDEDDDEREDDVGFSFNAATEEFPSRTDISRPNVMAANMELEMELSVSHCCNNRQLPAVVVKNNCGEDIMVSLFVNSTQPSAFTTCIANAMKIGSVVAPAQSSSRLYTPWSTIYDNFSGPVFPIITCKMDMRDGSSYSASPTPLHTLSSRPLFLTRHFVDGDEMLDSDESSLGVAFIPAVVMTHETQRGESDLHVDRHSTTLRARSNIQFKNLSGGDFKIRATAKSQEFSMPLEIDMLDLQSRGLPIYMITDRKLSISVFNEKFQMWSDEVLLLDLIDSNVKRHQIGCNIFFFGKERIEDPVDKRFIFDYTIEIVSGLKLVNSLPYRIEVQYLEKISRRPENGELAIVKSAPSRPIALNAGQETLLPIGLQIHMASTISIRIVGQRSKKSPRTTAKTKWSSPIQLNDIFKGGVSNVTDEDMTVPCTFTRSLQTTVRVRKIRDPSKEDVNSKYSSTPTVEVYTDLWIQNNSGVPLWYKVKRKSGESELLGDFDAGPNDFAIRSKKVFERLRKIGSEAMGNDRVRETPVSGPIMGLIDVKTIRFKCDTRSNPVGDVVSLQGFGNITTYLPNISDTADTAWSPKVNLSSQFSDKEVVCDKVWLGISLTPAVGVFSKTMVLVITPRYIVQNMTSLGIEVFPVQLLKRMRRSATEKEHQDMREAADTYLESFTSGESDEMWSYDIETILKSEVPMSPFNRVSRTPSGDFVDEPHLAKRPFGVLPPGDLRKTLPSGHDKSDHGKSANWKSYADLGKAINTAGIDTDEDEMDDVENAKSAFTDDRSLFSSSARTIDELSGRALKAVTSDTASVFNVPAKTAASFLSFTKSANKFGMHKYFPALSLKVASDPHLLDMEGHVNMLVVKVISARGLAKADVVGSSDPMCEVYWQGEKLFQTKTVRNNLNPIWNHEYVIPIELDTILESELRFEVHDMDVGSKGDFLGCVILNSDDILDTVGGKVFQRPLQQRRGKFAEISKYVQGNLTFQMTLERRKKNLWSAPVPISNRNVEYITARCDLGRRHMLEISVKDIDSVVVVVIREHNATNLPAFKVVNRVPDLQLRFRQHGTNPTIVPRYILKPAGFMYFSWSDPSLPKHIELVAVDYLGNESPSVIYKLENVSSSLQSLNVSQLENERRELKAQVVVEGHTRVLIISNVDNTSKKYGGASADRKYDLVCSVMSAADLSMSLTGVSVTLIDEEPQELINLTIDEIVLKSPFNSREWEFTIKHIQLDNMLMSDTKYQVILSPPDSGLNSHLHEDYSDVEKKHIPFFKVIMDPDFDNVSLTKDAFVVNYLEWQMQELLLRVDFNFVVKMATSIITPSILDALEVGMKFFSVLVKDPISKTEDLLIHQVNAPTLGFFPNFMMFAKTLRLHSAHIKLLLSIAVDNVDIDPRSIGAKIEYSTVQNIMSLSRGITNINPSFDFAGVVIKNAFDSVEGLACRIAKLYASQAAVQSLKILGSAEIFGDPVGGIASLGSSVRMFVKKTKSEIVGHSTSHGEGVKSLVQGVAGISFGTAAKMSNGFGEQLASISGSDYKAYMQQQEPTHLLKGVYQGGSVFMKTMANGVINLGKMPLDGIRQRSVTKTAVGVVTGVSGIALAPVIGILGATAKVSQGIESTTHIFDQQPIGRRRPARALFHNPQLQPLHLSVIFTEFKLNIRGVDLFIPEDLRPKLLRPDGSALYQAAVVVSYGKERRSTPYFDLLNNIRCDAFDPLYSFKFSVAHHKSSYKRKNLKIKLVISKHRSIVSVSPGLTVSKCYVHPLDLVGHFHAEKTFDDLLRSAGLSSKYLQRKLYERYRSKNKSNPSAKSPLLNIYLANDKPVVLKYQPPTDESVDRMGYIPLPADDDDDADSHNDSVGVSTMTESIWTNEGSAPAARPRSTGGLRRAFAFKTAKRNSAGGHGVSTHHTSSKSVFICQALPVRANSDCCPSFLEEEDEVFSIDLMSKMTEGEGGDNGDELLAQLVQARHHEWGSKVRRKLTISDQRDKSHKTRTAFCRVYVSGTFKKALNEAST